MISSLLPRFGRSFLLHQTTKRSISSSATLFSSESPSNNIRMNETCANTNTIYPYAHSETEQSPQEILRSLEKYHPLFVEGKANGDMRDPRQVTDTILQNLQQYWKKNQINKKPVIMIIQGDPLTPTGISAITRMVASDLNITRVLICFDDTIDPNHSKLADRENVSMELRFSELEHFLDNELNDVSQKVFPKLRTKINERIKSVNDQLQQDGLQPLRSYVEDYALLQEGAKAAIKKLCGEITVLHTYNPPIYSVTGFYEVGLDVGTAKEEDMVFYDSPC